MTQTEAATTQAPTTAAERAAAFSTFAPWLQADPIPYWQELRESGPVVRSEAHGGYWILTRHEDISHVARNPDLFLNAQPLIPWHPLMGSEKQIPLELDGELHRSWRRTLAEAFNPASVAAITPRIRQAAQELIDPIVEKGHCEFINEFAETLPAEAFLANFGIKRDRLEEFVTFKNWYIREALPNAQSGDDIIKAMRPLRRFFDDEVERRRAEDDFAGPDVISHLMRTTLDGRPLTLDEISNASFVTMLASLDTTTSALGLAWARLAREPQTRALVTRAPEALPRLVEELIRLEPVLTTARVVAEDTELHGLQLKAGDAVLMSWGLAGLDPDAFDNPEELSTDRVRGGQLAFGVGPHRCLGMHVARRVLTIALEEWHARIPDYHLDPTQPPVYRYSSVRGINQLALQVG